jgi:predicted GNAT family N-acyltransferase
MVRQDRHRNGLGRLLAHERLAAIDRSGVVERVELQTSQHTVGFYERLGFAAVSVEPDGFAPGIDRIVMARG